MFMFIKKIFNKEFDEAIHSEFLKFGKGEFKDKYIIHAKRQKEGWLVKTSSEFANYFVDRLLKNVSGNLYVTGTIVSTFDIREPLGGFVFNENEEVKQFMGIKQLKVDSEISRTRLIEVLNKFPRAFFALSFSTIDGELKIKAKAPKSAKPSTSGEKEAKADFCSLKTSNPEIIKELFFDCQSFNEIAVNHTIIISEIVYPENVANLKPEEIRTLSRRKGKIVRTISVDGKEEIREADFEY
jgi:hypothetical protein